MLVHYFGGVAAGRLFLPMQFFVLAAGLLLGWRGGLVVGILTPLISYSLTGMPAVSILPFIIVESSVYGFLVGFFQEKLKNAWLSLVGALIVGRAILFFSIILLPTKLVASSYVFSAIKDGWRGILLQIILLPIAIAAVSKFLKNERI